MKSYVLISGAAGGLGKAFCAECARRGWDLFLTDLNAPALAALAEGMERLYGVEVRTQACDLTQAAEREALWARAEREGLRLYGIMNVAGLDFEGPFGERKVDELRTIIRLNIEATVEMTSRALAFRDPAREMLVVNVCSLAGYYPMPLKAMYAASKRFLLDLSLALHYELRPQGIRVLALCPGGMPTNREVIASIDSQGFWGWATAVNVGDVAGGSIEHVLAGKAVYIPGFLNQVLYRLGGLFPAGMVAGLIHQRWARTRERKAQCEAAELAAVPAFHQAKIELQSS